MQQKTRAQTQQTKEKIIEGTFELSQEIENKHPDPVTRKKHLLGLWVSMTGKQDYRIKEDRPDPNWQHSRVTEYYT